MTNGQVIVVIAWTNLAVWLILAGVGAWMRVKGIHIPDYLVAAAIVATCSAAIGGAATSLSFIGAASPEMWAVGWRAAMLMAGVYGLVGLWWRARPRRR